MFLELLNVSFDKVYMYREIDQRKKHFIQFIAISKEHKEISFSY